MSTNSSTHDGLIRMLRFDSQNPALWAEFMRRFQDHICFVVTRELKQQAGVAPPELTEQLVQKVYLRLLADSAHALQTYRGRQEDSIYRYLEIIAIRAVVCNTGVRHGGSVRWTVH